MSSERTYEERTISSICSAWRRRNLSASPDSFETFACELADRLEHPVALLAEAARATAKETLVEERAECVEIGVANSLRGLERAPAAKDAQAGEQPLLVLLEKVVRPRDRRPQRGVPFVGVPRALQYVEAVTEPLEELLRCQQLRPCRRELESEREAIQPLAELARLFPLR